MGNTVVKQLQAGNIGSVLVNSKLPTNLLMFLLPLCDSKQVPVVGLDNLDIVTKSAMGFSCTVLGFMKDVNQGTNYFYEVNNTIMTASMQFGHSKCVDVALHTIQRSSPKDPPTTSNKTNMTEQCTIQNVHLKRKSSSNRVFIPVGKITSPVEDPPEQAPPRKK